MMSSGAMGAGSPEGLRDLQIPPKMFSGQMQLGPISDVHIFSKRNFLSTS